MNSGHLAADAPILSKEHTKRDLLNEQRHPKRESTHPPTVTGKSYATLIQEFFVGPPEGVEKVWTWCNQSPIYKVDLSPAGILQ